MDKVGFIGLGRMGRGMASNLCVTPGYGNEELNREGVDEVAH